MEFSGGKFMKDYSYTDTEFSTLEMISIMQSTEIETENERLKLGTSLIRVCCFSVEFRLESNKPLYAFFSIGKYLVSARVLKQTAFLSFRQVPLFLKSKLDCFLNSL